MGCARALLWSPSGLQGRICPCTPCLASLQHPEPVWPLSAVTQTGTVPASALVGILLEPAANSAWWHPTSTEVLRGIKVGPSVQSSCPLPRVCVREPRVAMGRVFALRHPWAHPAPTPRAPATSATRGSLIRGSEVRLGCYLISTHPGSAFK